MIRKHIYSYMRAKIGTNKKDVQQTIDVFCVIHEVNCQTYNTYLW